MGNVGTAAEVNGGERREPISFRNCKPSAATTFTSTLDGFNTAASVGHGQSSVLADVYAAVLANPTEADSGLAAAIKETTVSHVTLTSVANDALRATTASLTANLSIVDQVATELKRVAVLVGGGISDLFGYVGSQIIISPALTKDIVIAATVIAHELCSSLLLFGGVLQSCVAGGHSVEQPGRADLHLCPDHGSNGLWGAHRPAMPPAFSPSSLVIPGRKHSRAR